MDLHCPQSQLFSFFDALSVRLTLLCTERPKLHRVLVVLSTIGFKVVSIVLKLLYRSCSLQDIKTHAHVQVTVISLIIGCNLQELSTDKQWYNYFTPLSSL